MSSAPPPTWLRRRLAGAGAGALAGLLLVQLELVGQYLPALRGTDLQPSALVLVAALVLAVPPLALAGAVHRGLAYLLALALAPAGAEAPLVAGGLALLACGLAELARWRLWAAALAVAPALLALVLTRPPAPSAGPAADRPDIVLVVLDTVGAAPTSLHGHALDTTPALQALAAESTVFTQATSPAPWTVPSHASMLTGRLPREAGCHHEHPSLPEHVPTTAEALAAAGYRTGAFLANPWVGRFNGLTRGFTHQESQWELVKAVRAFSVLRRVPAAPNKGGASMRDAALRWLDAEADAPAFVLINLLEAHSPFHETPGATRYGVADPEGVGTRTHRVQEAGLGAVPDYPRPGELDEARRLYAAGIRHVDDLVGELVAALRARGRWERTVLIVTSDHGEAFGEHGFHGHMVGLHQETLHVPLVVRVPGQAPAEVAAPVSTAALHATVLGLAGLPGEAQVPALPLRGEAPPPGPVLSEQFRPLQVLSDMRRAGGEGELGELDHRAVRARDERWAVLAREPAGGGPVRWSLYDLVADPVEADDLWAAREALGAEEAQAVAALETEVRARLAAPVATGTGLRLDSDLRAELQALGYLGGE